MLSITTIVVLSLTCSQGISTRDDLEPTQIKQNATSILKSLKYHLNQFELSASREAVLIFGNEGSGKTTIARVLSGGNLTSIKKDGEFVINDDNSMARTLNPEIFVSESSGIVLYEMPGSKADDKVDNKILRKYVQEQLFTHLESVKFLFVIGHQSIFDTEDFNNNFECMVKNAIALMKNIERFGDGIGLVVTNVNNQWNVNDNGLASLANNDIEDLEAIKSKLNSLKDKFKHKTEDQNYNDEAIKFLDVLIGTDSTADAKISIMRKPIRPGPLNNRTSFKNDKNVIDVLVNKKLHFIRNGTNTFWDTSKSADYVPEKGFIFLLGEGMLERLHDNIENIIDEIQTFYSNKRRKLFDLPKLNDIMKFAHQTFAEINAGHPQMLLKQILNATKVLDIEISADVLQTTKNDIQTFDFLAKIASGEMLPSTTESINERIKDLLMQLKESEKWYQFLMDVQKRLSEKKFDEMVSGAQDPEHNGQYAEEFVKKHTKKIDTEMYNQTLWASEGGVEHLLVKSFEYERYLAVLREFFNDEIEYICSSDKYYIEKGFNIFSNNFNQNAKLVRCWWNVDQITIFALNRLNEFFFNRKIHSNLQHYVIGPKLGKSLEIYVLNGVKVQLKNITIFDSNNNPIGS